MSRPGRRFRRPSSMPGSTLGRPYWASSEVRFAAAIYLAMVLLTFTTFWSIRRGLQRFAERARLIRERRSSGGSSFRAQNDIPELADVAEEFDHMVEVLDASARDIRRAAEDNAHAFKTPIAVIRQSLEPVKRAIAAENRRGLRAIGLIESSLDKLDGLVASARRLDEATADLMEMPRTDIDLSRVLGRLLQAHADVFVERHLRLKGHIAPGVMIHANEGSEYLDYAIQRLFGTAKPVPLYTRSLDAALKLVPEGWTIHRLGQLTNCQGGFGGWIGEIYRASDAMIPYPSSAPAASAPLAICVAAMRVRHAEASDIESTQAAPAIDNRVQR